MITPKEYSAKRMKLKKKLEEIDRLDLLKKPDVRKYFYTNDEPTCDGCIEILLNLFPEKKIYEEVYRYDCYSD